MSHSIRKKNVPPLHWQYNFSYYSSQVLQDWIVKSEAIVYSHGDAIWNNNDAIYRKEKRISSLWSTEVQEWIKNNHWRFRTAVNTCLEQPLLHNQARIQVNSLSLVPPTLYLLAFPPAVQPSASFCRSLSHQYIIESWSCILNQKDWSIMK